MLLWNILNPEASQYKISFIYLFFLNIFDSHFIIRFLTVFEYYLVQKKCFLLKNFGKTDSLDSSQAFHSKHIYLELYILVTASKENKPHYFQMTLLDGSQSVIPSTEWTGQIVSVFLLYSIYIPQISISSDVYRCQIYIYVKTW